MRAFHEHMKNMICIHSTRSSILLTSEEKKGRTSMSIIPEQFADILESSALASMATVGPKGEPQVSTVLFAWNGTQLIFSMHRSRQKHRNLSRDPRIAVNISDPANPYRSLEIR